MKPILYESTETKFDDNGIGRLSDALSCLVTEQRNGEYFLEMTYPIYGAHFGEIRSRSIILAKANATSELQPFRVYRITKPLDRKVKVYANHIRQDLDGVPVSPFTSISAADAMNKLSLNAIIQTSFTFQTDKTTAATMTVKTPSDIKTLLYGTQGGILDVYGGEFEFDRYRVILHNERGMDRGVSVRYGKNLTSLEQDENCANVFTGVYPYYADSQGNLTELPEKVVLAEGTYNFTKYKMLDLSTEWQTTPTESQLRDRAERYIEENKIGIPKVSLDFSFIQLEQTEEYKGKNLLERVSLCDTVSVEFPDMGVSAQAKVIETVYNVLLERYENCAIGEPRTRIIKTLFDQSEAIKNLPDKQTVSQEIANKLASAMGVHGGCIRFVDTNNDGEPDELYIADAPDPEQALKVWRFNYQGWAASKSGYTGPFELGATLEDGLLANFVTAANLTAGVIRSQDGSVLIDLNNNSMDIVSNSLTIDSDNFKLDANGNVRASDIVADGIFTSTKYVDDAIYPNNKYTVNLDTDGLRFTADDEEEHRISNIHNWSFPSFEVSGDGFLNIFSRTGICLQVPNKVIGDGRSLWINNVFAPMGFTEDVVNIGDFCVYGYIRAQGEIKFGWYDQHKDIISMSATTGFNDTGYGVMVTGDFGAHGSIGCLGTKYRIVQTDHYGAVGMNAMESATAVFSDMGEVTLDETGYAEVALDPVFMETVDLNHSYHVFASHGITSIEKYTDYFALRGAPNACIDWIVYYRQKGYTMARADSVNFEETKNEESIPDSIFAQDNAGAIQSEMMMEKFPDTAEEYAAAYLENYEKELIGYAY